MIGSFAYRVLMICSLTTSSALLRMLFILRTHSIWSAAFRLSVIPSCIAIRRVNCSSMA